MSVVCDTYLLPLKYFLYVRVDSVFSGKGAYYCYDLYGLWSSF